MPNGPLQVRVDLEQFRANVRDIARKTGVEVHAVVKADAYGLGAVRISDAIQDLVAGWCVFSLREAADARLWERTGKRSLALGPADEGAAAEDYRRYGVAPAVADLETAQRLAPAGPVLCIDTGMQRFACPPDRIAEVVRSAGIREAFTHAIRMEQVRLLEQAGRPLGLRLHAAASSLLNEPGAWLDAVRPGLALYRGAVRVSTPLVEVRESKGPIGYTGFSARRHGVILCGYSHGLRRGNCVVNGQRRRIPEVGMQSAYVELGDADHRGDDVVLLGDGLELDDLARDWGSTPHEVLLNLGRNRP